MTKIKATLDVSNLEAKLSQLTGSQLIQAGEKGAMKGAKIIQAQAYSNFGSLNNKSTRGRRGSLVDSTYQGRKLKTVAVKYGRGTRKTGRTTSNAVVFVNILGDFRAKFFELGTKERHTLGRKVSGYVKKGRQSFKKRTGRGRYTGRIERGLYFSRAITSKQAEAQQAVADAFVSAVNKIKTQ